MEQAKIISTVIALFLFFSCQAALEHHSSAFSSHPPPMKSRALYLMHKGELSAAFREYERYREETETDDYELLQEMALTLLEQGSVSSDAETQLLSIFGAGISSHEKALPILQKGLESDIPEIQLISLNFLSTQNHDDADEAIQDALLSSYPLTRLEATYLLAKKKHHATTAFTEALMHKMPLVVKPLFAIIFAEDGSPNAIKILRKMMNDPETKVRVAAIISAVDHERDELLPKIRLLSSQHNTAQQEACAFALGAFRDEKSVAKLEKMARSHCPAVHLTAWYSLYQMGRTEYAKLIEEKARLGDVFAITLLGKIEGAENLLYQLAQYPDMQIRLNAILALIQHGDKRVAPLLREILITDTRDLLFVKISSHGKALTAWKVLTGSKEKQKENPGAQELSIALREEVLIRLGEMSETVFLPIAKQVFEEQQNELVPVLIQILENLRTPDAIHLLKQQQLKLGAPLIRYYSTLALVHLNVPGPYFEQLYEWIIQQKDVDLIRFRAFVPLDFAEKEEAGYELTPEETSRLYVDALETIITHRDRKGIQALLEIIEHGNSKNRYALAGLLLRAIQ